MLRLWTTGMFFFFLLVPVLPRMAMGHAFPDHAEPKVGSTVSSSPSRVRVWFTADLEPVFSTIVVLDSAGRKVDKGDGRVSPSDATLLEAGLPPLPAGTYRVVWDVAARDGHRTKGDHTFVIK